MTLVKDRPYVRKIPDTWNCHDWTPKKLAEILPDVITGRIGNTSEEILDEENCEKLQETLGRFFYGTRIFYDDDRSGNLIYFYIASVSTIFAHSRLRVDFSHLLVCAKFHGAFGG